MTPSPHADLKILLYVRVHIKLLPWKFLILDRSFLKRQTSSTLSDNEWQQVTTSSTTNDNEWQRVIQRVTTSDTTSDNEWYNERQRVSISANFPFFIIWEEATIKHPKENSLNIEEDLRRRPIEIKSRNKPLRRNINSKKEEWQKQLFADFHQSKCS